MTTLDQEIQAIDREIKLNAIDRDLGKALDNLNRNKDFQKLVLHGYFESEAVRLVHAKADPDLQTPEAQASILVQIDAIGHLSSYFRTIGQRAEMAGRSIATAEELRAELLAQPGTEG